jgi:hypothetical protein
MTFKIPSIQYRSKSFKQQYFLDQTSTIMSNYFCFNFPDATSNGPTHGRVRGRLWRGVSALLSGRGPDSNLLAGQQSLLARIKKFRK